jgi:hypothetical protein
MKVLSNHHPEHTFRRLEPGEAAATLEKNIRIGIIRICKSRNLAVL